MTHCLFKTRPQILNDEMVVKSDDDGEMVAESASSEGLQKIVFVIKLVY